MEVKHYGESKHNQLHLINIVPEPQLLQVRRSRFLCYIAGREWAETWVFAKIRSLKRHGVEGRRLDE